MALLLLYLHKADEASLTALCSELRKWDKPERAIEAAEGALDLNPNSVAAMTTKAAALLDMGNGPAAHAVVRAAWAIKPDAYLASTYARMYLQEGLPDDAVEKALFAMETGPSVHAAHMLLAAATAAQDRDALQKANDWIVANGTDQDPHPSNYATVRAAEILVNEGRLDDASRALNTVLDDNPKYRLARDLKNRISYERKKQQGNLF